MAKQNKNNGVDKKNKNNDTNNNDGGEKKEDGSIAFKIVKWAKSFQGAESVKSEGQANKLTVVGKVDPTKLRDELATKTKNKVDLVSPQPKTDNEVNKDDAIDTKKKQPEKTDNDEKPKEAPLTAISKMRLNVSSVAKRIKFRVVSKTEAEVIICTELTDMMERLELQLLSLLKKMQHLKSVEEDILQVPINCLSK